MLFIVLSKQPPLKALFSCRLLVMLFIVLSKPIKEWTKGEYVC